MLSSKSLYGQILLCSLYVPDTARTTLIQRQSAHSAVVLPGTFPLAHFGVVALKRVAMRQVARKNGPRTSSQVRTKAPEHITRLSKIAEGNYVQLNKKITHSCMESGPQAAMINISFFCCASKGGFFHNGNLTRRTPSL